MGERAEKPYRLTLRSDEVSVELETNRLDEGRNVFISQNKNLNNKSLLKKVDIRSLPNSKLNEEVVVGRSCLTKDEFAGTSG